MVSEPFIWQVVISLAGVGLQTHIAIIGWRQTAKNTRDSLDVQHLVSQRATASFIAEKRQKWIDELRSDMAFHLALSQEIIWEWKAIKDNASSKLAALIKGNEKQRDIIAQKILDDFSKENGARDREHQERHIRIKFRLNPEEQLHINLLEHLDSIRDLLSKMQVAKRGQEANGLVEQMKELVNDATKTTQTILKKEWQRLKQEVAYPEALISTISHPKSQ